MLQEEGELWGNFAVFQIRGIKEGTTLLNTQMPIFYIELRCVM